MKESISCIIDYIFSTPGSTAIFFSVTISSLLSIIIFLANGWREKRKASLALKLQKIESLFSKLHQYSRTSKMYLWSIKKETQDITKNKVLAEEARELLYECEIFKHLYFDNLPLDPAYQYAEMERIAGECYKIWMRVPDGENIDIQHRLDACKAVGIEITKFDKLLKPVTDWCLLNAKKHQ